MPEMDPTKLFERRTTTLDEVAQLVSGSLSKAQVLRKLGLGVGGANYRWLTMVINRYSLCTKHFTGQGHLRNKRCPWTRTIPLQDILTKDSTYQNSGALKRRLFTAGLLRNQCYTCDQLPVWRGEKLVLQLDHIDGDPANNTIDNLRILCPNCHSQTKTYGNKNRSPLGGTVDTPRLERGAERREGATPSVGT